MPRVAEKRYVQSINKRLQAIKDAGYQSNIKPLASDAGLSRKYLSDYLFKVKQEEAAAKRRFREHITQMEPDRTEQVKKLKRSGFKKIAALRQAVINKQNTLFGMAIFAKAEIVFHAKEMEDEWGNTTHGPDRIEYKLLTTVIKRKTRAALEKIKRDLTNDNVHRFLTQEWNAMKRRGQYDGSDFPGFVEAGSGPIEQINIDIQIREYFAPKVFEIDYN